MPGLGTTKKEKINTLSYDSKTHSTLKEKKIISLYAEDLHFLKTRAGWLVTHIYAHCTFEQSKFKNGFVAMNQKARQTAESKVEKDFYKLLNNSNFGIDCGNAADNCTLNQYMMIFQKLHTLKIMLQYSTTILLEISFPLPF